MLNQLHLKKYSFQRGKIDACVYRCQISATILIHHVGDFDVCGPAEALKELLEIQLLRFWCKLKVCELEGMEGERGTSSECLGKETCAVDDCVVTKPNDKHVQTIL